MLSSRKIDVADLEIGMYVAALDRPWLETPFLFQGFYIRDADEIEQLRNHCEYVFVTAAEDDVDISHDVVAMPAAAVHATVSKKSRWRFSLKSLFGRRAANDDNDQPADEQLKQTGVIYRKSTTFKDELQTATGVHRKAVLSVKDVMKNMQATGSLDLDSLEDSVTPLVDSVLRNPAALSCLVRMQQTDDYLYSHSLASSIWATILGRQIGLYREDLDVLALGAMLLDVGKTQLPRELLIKPGKLSDEEQALMRRHVRFGLDLLEKSRTVDDRVLEMVAHHHERHNGTGYPQGLKGMAIPVFGRIAGIVDAYDAMITRRPYAEPVSSYDALRKLRVLADVEFQAELVDQFTRAIGVFPTGTLVELNTGEIGIVTQQNRIRRLRPEIMIIMGPDKQLLDDFEVMDLNDETVSAATHDSVWIERGLPPGAYDIDPTEFYLD